MKHLYDKEYYSTGNYKNYLSKKKRYEKTAQDLIELLAKLKCSHKDMKILDYGCATGFLLDGFYNLGYKNTNGYDISDWALSQISRNHNIISLSKETEYDVMIMLDVLEHMEDKDINNLFTKVKSKLIFIRIPVSTDGGNSFHLDVSRADPTHINCKEKTEWVSMLGDLGYRTAFELDLQSIYSTDGVFCALLINKGEEK